MNNLIERAKNIKCLICDLDGVLTDGLLYIDNHFNESKTFHIRDGVGLKLLMAAGIEVAVITGSRNAVVDHRMQQLGIVHYYKDQLDKQETYKQLKTKLSLQDEQFAYIGDDLPDAPIMQQVGLSVAVANAVHQIKEIAMWQTALPGGHGAVRELCDLILSAQNKMDLAIAGYLK
ncbi:3-deoxy-manno-octulosonate-8-phosphatase KdsC [Fluoribacter dumoffii]|uniref:3-deoxy-D-manno-octulosonate 8-phosphate phosphatase KdsC n=1 Tax=Fluoribacter dumoffii TaxID=463 RepID=A0A377GAP6_9GAMM|nr:3-deoxy-manno-octulosonate-8-phosphatase KdsC [Fluoribacter dumoffii]KTC88659.1 3-deoxy-D-manno-octulosonate 8-phosphate phosphatase [Fluoribacter dumoffii NY 23]MCW8386048.1 3-deoxy-manno-octulosonate-8-phosphatase KdsC [Fluoribacter dumoffii]MCW8419100.1 3-deoxy-manno-octulosonate-8-phosphatase KdsC [Fluoribacter dumoffii]MCW8453056.1 3-deoxy-manno-octulosonate-8-phosphatase KdsC [Fluoribacter dumoffii]MCW8459726.1 3-deoxy-manno-octulosonate-8-phosphatase KdsC [Fluoribacter dumoffii]